MADKITVSIELDADIKAAAEKLYRKIDLTLEEAIPLLVKYNVEQEEGAIPARDWQRRIRFCHEETSRPRRAKYKSRALPVQHAASYGDG